MKWSTEEIETMHNMYGKVKIEVLEKVLDRTRQAIQKKAQKLGIKGNQKIAQSKYSHNENFFKTPNSDNCYWAGFIAADGCVDYSRGMLKIDISRKDRCLLEEFKKCIEYTGPIRDFEANGFSYSGIIIWSSFQVVKDLRSNFNITERKSNTLKPPVLDNDFLDYSFIVGYLDGDGCIQNSNVFSIGFCGTENMMQWIKNCLDRLVDYNLLNGNQNKQVSIRRNGNSLSNKKVSFRGKRGLIIAQELDKLYSGFKLKRKWDKVYG